MRRHILRSARVVEPGKYLTFCGLHGSYPVAERGPLDKRWPDDTCKTCIRNLASAAKRIERKPFTARASVQDGPEGNTK